MSYAREYPHISGKTLFDGDPGAGPGPTSPKTTGPMSELQIRIGGGMVMALGTPSRIPASPGHVSVTYGGPESLSTRF